MREEIFRQFQQIEDLAKTTNEVRFGPGVSPQDIQTAEEILRLKFPDSFRYFLTHYGTAQIFADEIFGLYPGVQRENYDDKCPLVDLIYFSLKERENFGINQSWLLIMNQDGDRKYYLDISKTLEGEGPVLKISIDDPSVANPYAQSFIEFLLKRISFFS